jgi:hypothetical protein
MHHKTRTLGKSFKYAYVTFTDMEHVKIVQDAYTEDFSSSCKRKYTMCCSSNKDSRKEYEKKHFFKQWPTITVPCNPENINWENIGYSRKWRCCRISGVWLLAAFLVLISLFITFSMSDPTSSLIWAVWFQSKTSWLPWRKKS